MARIISTCLLGVGLVAAASKLPSTLAHEGHNHKAIEEPKERSDGQGGSGEVISAPPPFETLEQESTAPRRARERSGESRLLQIDPGRDSGPGTRRAIPQLERERPREDVLRSPRALDRLPRDFNGSESLGNYESGPRYRSETRQLERPFNDCPSGGYCDSTLFGSERSYDGIGWRQSATRGYQPHAMDSFGCPFSTTERFDPVHVDMHTGCSYFDGEVAYDIDRSYFQELEDYHH